MDTWLNKEGYHGKEHENLYRRTAANRTVFGKIRGGVSVAAERVSVIHEQTQDGGWAVASDE